MPIVKRYPNRKLYNTETKQYITLEGIAELIRQGQETQIVDHATGEDLTTVTLTQIILEAEKKQAGFLPQSVLTGLVQAGGHTLSALQRTLTSSLDLWRQMDEEIEQRIQALVWQGDLTETEGRGMLDKLVAPLWLPLPSEQEIERVMASRGVPSRSDLDKLNQQVEELSATLENLSKRKKRARKQKAVLT